MLKLILLLAFSVGVMSMGKGKCTHKPGYFGLYLATKNCAPYFHYKGRQYQACTDIENGPKKFWCYSDVPKGMKAYDCYTQFENGCVPKISSDHWQCNNFPNAKDISLDLGSGANFCGQNLRSFPECDPQLPPTITFHSKSGKIGVVDMKKDLSQQNAVIDNVKKIGSSKDAMIVYIVHGFTQNGEEDWQQKIKDGIMKKYPNKDIVVGIVGWGWGAMNHIKPSNPINDPFSAINSIWADVNMGDGVIINLPNMFEDGLFCGHASLAAELYRKASSDTMAVGWNLAVLDGKFANFNQHYCIGHSLGAHTCGFFGQYYAKQNGKKLTGIVGLDPAGPIFDENSDDQKLSKDDADFVQAIHTDYSLLGHKKNLGHVDYYINGGDRQPSSICPYPIPGLVAKCSHEFSCYYLAKLYNNGLKCYGQENGSKSPEIGDLLVNGSSGVLKSYTVKATPYDKKYDNEC